MKLTGRIAEITALQRGYVRHVIGTRLLGRHLHRGILIGDINDPDDRRSRHLFEIPQDY